MLPPGGGPEDMWGQGRWGRGGGVAVSPAGGYSLQAPPSLLLPGTHEPLGDPPPGRPALVFPAQAPAKK